MNPNNFDAVNSFAQNNLFPWFSENRNHPNAIKAILLGSLALPNENLNPRKPLLNFALTDIKYEGLAEFDTETEIDSATYKNGTPVQQTFTFTSNKQTIDTFTYDYKEGVKIGVSYGTDVPISNFKVTGEFSFEASQTVTATKSRSWTNTQTVVVPPNTTTRVAASFKQRQVSGLFTAIYTVSLTSEGLKVTNNIPLEVAFPGLNCQLETKGTVSGAGGVDINVSLTTA